MKNLLLIPPVAFFIILIFSAIMTKIASAFSFKQKSRPEGQSKPYACGEDFQKPRVQPGYSQFFPFAFFFTIMHVLALIVTTVPVIALGYCGNAFLYIIGAACGLLILFRKNS